MAYIFAEEYKKNLGRKVIGVVPLEDQEFGISWLDLDICTEVHNAKTWRCQPEELVLISDVMICFGLSVGSIIEIAYSKWFPVRRIFLISEFVSKLPPELRTKIHATYIPYKEVLEKI